jgi:flagellar motor switch protein FliM
MKASPASFQSQPSEPQPQAIHRVVPPEFVVPACQATSGLVNIVTPTSAVVMGGLAIARVGYGTWLRFVWPVLVLLAILVPSASRPDAYASSTEVGGTRLLRRAGKHVGAWYELDV